MNSYNVVLTGKTPLLLHRDNIEVADQLERWRQDPSNQKLSTVGPEIRDYARIYNDKLRPAVRALHRHDAAMSKEETP